MRATFNIVFETSPGQSVYIVGSPVQLGKWETASAIKMKWDRSGVWRAALEFDESDAVISYKYFVAADHAQHPIRERGENRLLHLKEDLWIRDWWRPRADPAEALFTSPFINAFFSRDRKSPTHESPNGNVTFRLRAARIDKDHQFGILGSCPELGSWQEEQVLLLEDPDFPVWQTSIDLKKKKALVEYKYVICRSDDHKVVAWEFGENRKLIDFPQDQALLVNDEAFRYPSGNWKGAGVAIPVFSLRSGSGTGVGEFADLRLLTDWAVRTGMRLLQILPVNDTIATHTWRDSYPYAAISVHALHPLYANLQEVGKLRDKQKQSNIDSERARLNQLEEVNYEAVISLKLRFFRDSFRENKATFLKSKDFRLFYERNESWLKPYAVFSYLRDLNGTADFSKWGPHASVTTKQLEKLASPYAEQYDQVAVFYYMQYHLDKQLTSVSEYARERGVVLKGDIPIGIYRNSVDAWMTPEVFNMDCQAGAPPDDFSVTGQNWGFPTYNWERMAKNGFRWWTDRLVKMSEYFDVFRIDHILGFFRIWEIPMEHVQGVMGRFNPALPLTGPELQERGLHFDCHRFCEPYIRRHTIQETFGSHADLAVDRYLYEYAPGCYSLREAFNTQQKVKAHFDRKNEEEPAHVAFHNWLRDRLYALNAEVLFIRSKDNPQSFYPRIAFHSTHSYLELEDGTKRILDKIYDHFFYHRHNEFWRESAMKKLPALNEATNMLICGEDLGMVPACVPGVMQELNLLSLAIQRMPNDEREFWHPADTPYLSVTSTSSHDMSTLREWWQEDPDRSQRFFNHILGKQGGAPFYCEPWLAKDIIRQHMHSTSIWAIFPVQDLLAVTGALRRVLPEEERINIPAISQHYWRYRLHIGVEELLNNTEYTAAIRAMVAEGGRAV